MRMATTAHVNRVKIMERARMVLNTTLANVLLNIQKKTVPRSATLRSKKLYSPLYARFMARCYSSSLELSYAQL